MDKKVIIYVLIDPFTLKVRYIGRTTDSLSERLSKHMSKSKTCNEKTHKATWMRALARKNTRPIIRKLTEVIGWTESHILEKLLIKRHKHRLINHYDRGEGPKGNVRSIEEKLQLSKSIKEGFDSGRIKHPRLCTVHVYDKWGNFLNTYGSQQEAAKAIGIHENSFNKVFNGTCKLIKGYQFSKIKVERMTDYSEGRTGSWSRIRRNKTAATLGSNT